MGTSNCTGFQVGKWVLSAKHCYKSQAKLSCRIKNQLYPSEIPCRLFYQHPEHDLMVLELPFDTDSEIRELAGNFYIEQAKVRLVSNHASYKRCGRKPEYLFLLSTKSFHPYWLSTVSVPSRIVGVGAVQGLQYSAFTRGMSGGPYATFCDGYEGNKYTLYIDLHGIHHTSVESQSELVIKKLFSSAHRIPSEVKEDIESWVTP